MNRNKLNVLMALLEHIITAVTMFVVYRLVVKYLGIETLGLWSILLAIMSLTSIGTSGFASSAVKFVSKYKTRGEIKKVVRVIETTFITVLSFSTCILILISLICFVFKNVLFNSQEYSIIIEIYPYLILSFLFGFSSSVYLSSLDGLKLIYIRSIIGLISKITFLVLAIILIKDMGLRGLAISMMIQNFIILILSSLFLKLKIPSLNILFLGFNKPIFKEIFNYGYQFQLTSIFQMLIDPLTKLLLKSTSGGLISVGYFEIVYKFLFHARQIIVVAINTVVPTVASIQENLSIKINGLFKSIFNVTIVFSIIILTGVFSIFPILLKIVDININYELSIYIGLIYFGLLFNLFSVTPFTFNLGTGNLRMNMFSMGLMALLNVFLSSIFGYFFSSLGVIIGWMLAQLIASMFLLRSYIKKENFNLREVFNKSDLILLVGIVVFLVSDILFNKYTKHNYILSSIYNVLIALIVLSYPLFMSDKFRFTLNYLKKKLIK